MKLVFLFFVLVAALLRSTDGTRAHADMFLAGTNDFIGTFSFYEDPEPWGVFIRGTVNRLRPLATLVSLYFEEEEGANSISFVKIYRFITILYLSITKMVDFYKITLPFSKISTPSNMKILRSMNVLHEFLSQTHKFLLA
jgi:hypothetical protein